jgi:hypothetical protein
VDESIQLEIEKALAARKEIAQPPEWWVWKYPNGSYCEFCLEEPGQDRASCLHRHCASAGDVSWGRPVLRRE